MSGWENIEMSIAAEENLSVSSRFLYLCKSVAGFYAAFLVAFLRDSFLCRAREEENEATTKLNLTTVWRGVDPQ